MERLSVVNCPSKRKTLTVVDLMDTDVDTSLKDIGRTVLILQNEIASALAEIAQLIKIKYSECIPTLYATSSLLDKVRATNENLKQVEKSLTDVVGSFQGDINDDDRSLSLRAEELRECLQKFSLIEKIEEDFSALCCSEIKESPLRYAKLVAAVQEHLTELSEKHGDIDETFAEKISPLLKVEYITRIESILHELNVYWDNIFSFSNQTGEFVMKIFSESKQVFEEHLEAMKILGSLDGRLAKLSKSILNNFCFPVIRDPNISLSVNRAVGLTKTASHYAIKSVPPSPHEARDHSADLENFFNLLTDLFTALYDDLGMISVGGVRLIALLYEKMSSDFMSVLLQDGIAKNISVGPEEDSKFEHMKSLTSNFLEFLEEKGFIESAKDGFVEFTKKLDVVWNRRHCTKIIVDARALISLPYLELETVGYGQVDECETMKELKAECDQLKVRSTSRDNFPRLLRFAKCQVSKSTVQLIELVRTTVLSAGKVESDDAAGRLIQTARNVIQFFISVAPRYHQTQISSVPQLAAVFYNNCYYMCHRLMTLPVDIPAEIKANLESRHLCITFVDFMPTLRALGADTMEKHLAQCRRQIATLLSYTEIFVNLDESRNLRVCEDALNSCSLYLTQIAHAWRDVLSNTVFAKALGNIVGFLFDLIIRIVLGTDDIREYDANLSAKLIAKMVEKMEELFKFDDVKQSSIHRFVETQYFRLKEILYCLDASLMLISSRWCSGKGPLAQWLQPSELRHLIKALFQVSEQRENVLKIIG